MGMTVNANDEKYGSPVHRRSSTMVLFVLFISFPSYLPPSLFSSRHSNFVDSIESDRPKSADQFCAMPEKVENQPNNGDSREKSKTFSKFSKVSPSALHEYYP